MCVYMKLRNCIRHLKLISNVIKLFLELEDSKFETLTCNITHKCYDTKAKGYVEVTKSRSQHIYIITHLLRDLDLYCLNELDF